MPKQDRVSVNLSDIRERIETVRSDVLWKEQSLTKKVRILLQEYLDMLESEKSTLSQKDQG